MVEIDSSLGKYRSSLDELRDHPSFGFVLEAIRAHETHLKSGFELKIEAGFWSHVGFGSSAAVTVATHAVLFRWIHGVEPEARRLFDQSLETIYMVQGRGSGADLAASVYGGVVGYTTEPHFEPLELSLPITAVYCGYKTPTPEVIEYVEQFRGKDPELYEKIYAEIDRSVGEAIAALRRKDYVTFGDILSSNHGLMNDMGVNTPELQEIVDTLMSDPDIYGAKISGSGMGDCAVGLGRAGDYDFDYPVYHLEITPHGCVYGG